MKFVYWLTWIMALVFAAGETARRGVGYFAVNATTMFEDYFCAAVLIAAAWAWHRRRPSAPMLMAGAWGYATGGMFVPFFAHLEAHLRGATIRPDHPHEDVQSIVTKGVIWAVCLICFVVTLKSRDARGSAD